MARRAFTLLEVLLVIMVIAIIVAILIPALGGARASANAATCMANLRQLGVGYMSFSARYMGRLPGNHSQWTENPAGRPLHYSSTNAQGYPVVDKPENEWMADWLAGMEQNFNAYSATNQANFTGFFSQPTRGSIYQYVNSPKAYRCPTLKVEKFGVGYGSNSRYDYTFVQCLNGARVDRVARTATAKTGPLGNSTQVVTLATPVLVEEDPANFLNSGTNLDGAWCWFDCTTYNHKGGTNIMTLDGSAYWFLPPYKFSLRAKEIAWRSTATNAIQYGDTDNRPFGFFNSF